MTIGTDNPVPSDHPLDLLANAMNFDDAMNSTDPTFTDRFGVSRVTWSGIKILPAKTWAELYALSAATYSGYQCVVTDLNNAIFISDGTDWNPNNNRLTVWKNKYPAFNPGSGTISASGSGNITLTTALPATFSGGVWLYLPTIATTPAITAGFYPCIMSSTTVGTICGSSNALPSNTFNTTPITFSVGSAYTGDVNEITTDSYSIPANLLRLGCTIIEKYIYMKTAGTSTVTVRSKLDGTTFNSSATLTSALVAMRLETSQDIITTTSAAGMNPGGGSFAATSNANVIDTSINLAAAIAVATTTDLVTATDNIGVVSSIIEIVYP